MSRLSTLSGFLTEKLGAIDDAVAGFGPGTWDSDAAKAYQAAHQQWATEARDFAEGVATARDAARLAHQKVQRAVEINGRMLGGA